MTARAIQFDGTHQSVLAVMRFVDAGRSTTTINIHASPDPATCHIAIPRPDGTVRARAGDWLFWDTDGQLNASHTDPRARETES